MVRCRWVSLLLGAILLTATAACEEAIVKKDPKPLPDAASMDGGVEVWDLRQRPTAAAVGIGDDDTTSVYESSSPRPLRLRLAGGETVELPTRYIAFSTLPNPDGKLVSVDVKTVQMPRDDAAERFESVLTQLGLPTEVIADFRRRAERASGTEWVRTERVSGKFGDLDLGVVTRYSPHSQHGLVALGGGWLGDVS